MTESREDPRILEGKLDQALGLLFDQRDLLIQNGYSDAKVSKFDSDWGREYYLSWGEDPRRMLTKCVMIESSTDPREQGVSIFYSINEARDPRTSIADVMVRMPNPDEAEEIKRVYGLDLYELVPFEKRLPLAIANAEPVWRVEDVEKGTPISR